MINGALQEFVSNVIAKGEVRYGDVRRLQRDYLPGGITHDEEFELLILLNASLVRADKAWTQWFASSISEFAVKQQASEDFQEVAEGVGHHLLAASKTKLSRRIVRQVQRELLRRLDDTAKPLSRPHVEAQLKHQARPEPQARTIAVDVVECSRSGNKARRSGTYERSARSRSYRVRREMRPRTIAATGGMASTLAYLPAFQCRALINVQSSRGAILPGPCR